MEKRKLRIEELRVEAFETVPTGAWIGGTALEEATLVCSEKRSCGAVCP